jgi:YibE/F-like protein
VGELARADPRLSRWELYRAGNRVGRAHVASVVNTLVLAYAGASLPLLLLIVVNTNGQDAGAVLTAQPIAQEIVRSAVATVGLVAAVPLTTALAAFVCGSARSGSVPAGGDGPGHGHGPGLAGPPPAVPPPPAGPPPPVVPAPARARHRRVDAGEALAPDPTDRPW